MNLEALQKEIEQLEQAGATEESLRQFFSRHPILFAIGHIYLGVGWFLRACLWTLVLLIGVVGLKVLWLAVQYMWRLV